MFDAYLVPQTLVYCAGTFYVLGLLIINQVALRLLVLTGTCFYMAYYMTIAAEPLWEAFYISVLIGLANVTGLAGLLARRSRLALPRAHRDVYAHFPSLPPGDFRTLMRHARRYVSEEERELTVEGSPVMRLYYVVSGKCAIRKQGDRFEMPAGVFVGEVAYLTGQRASATTRLEAGSEVLEWSFADLRYAASRSVRFKLALDAVLSLDLAQKVAMSVAPFSPAWRPELAPLAPPPQSASSFSNP